LHPMQNMFAKYADLLVNYSLALQKGERVFISSTYLAEPLLMEVHAAVLHAGAHPFFDLAMRGQEKSFFVHAQDHHLDFVSPFKKMAFEEFEAFLSIKAPYSLEEDSGIDPEKRKRFKKTMSAVTETYMQRTGSGKMKRCLCQFPTEADAKIAGMSLEEYTAFVFSACFLNAENPVDEWLKIRRMQQSIVDFLNTKKQMRYRHPDFDISFSCEGRTWINSDGRANMPSGEVFTSPVEDSVNGTIHFSFPGLQFGKEVEGVSLHVKDGEIISWSAEKGQDVLDEVFKLPGATRFGEAAIGTNSNIQRITRNILFDEKIGGSVHMAVGQSYYHCGGKNQSDIHWDMITDMKNGGEIFADGELIYKNGKFLIS